MKTIEQQTEKTILQKPLSIVVNGKEYKVPQPSIATLTMVSAEISVLPNKDFSKENVIQVVMSNAKFGSNIAKSLAVMILGAKAIEDEEKPTKRKWYQFKKEKQVGQFEKLTKEIQHEDIRHIVTEYVRILSSMNVQDFFTLITFLSEMNITKPTKEVIETTVSGR